MQAILEDDDADFRGIVPRLVELARATTAIERGKRYGFRPLTEESLRDEVAKARKQAQDGDDDGA